MTKTKFVLQIVVHAPEGFKGTEVARMIDRLINCGLEDATDSLDEEHDESVHDVLELDIESPVVIPVVGH